MGIKRTHTYGTRSSAEEMAGAIFRRIELQNKFELQQLIGPTLLREVWMTSVDFLSRLADLEGKYERAFEKVELEASFRPPARSATSATGAATTPSEPAISAAAAAVSSAVAAVSAFEARFGAATPRAEPLLPIWNARVAEAADLLLKQALFEVRNHLPVSNSSIRLRAQAVHGAARVITDRVREVKGTALGKVEHLSEAVGLTLRTLPAATLSAVTAEQRTLKVVQELLALQLWPSGAVPAAAARAATNAARAILGEPSVEDGREPESGWDADVHLTPQLRVVATAGRQGGREKRGKSSQPREARATDANRRDQRRRVRAREIPEAGVPQRLADDVLAVWEPSTTDVWQPLVAQEVGQVEGRPETPIEALQEDPLAAQEEAPLFAEESTLQLDTEHAEKPHNKIQGDYRQRLRFRS